MRKKIKYIWNRFGFQKVVEYELDFKYIKKVFKRWFIYKIYKKILRIK